MYQFHTFKHIHEINIRRGQHLSHIFSELDAEIFAPEPDFSKTRMSLESSIPRVKQR